jgi:hypothetical protein
VNAEVDHPRWSQKNERRIGELERRPTLLYNGYATEVALLGEPRAVVAALLAALGTPVRDGGFLAEAQAIMAAWRKEIAPRLASDAVAIDPARLCAEISRALPPDGILVADTGYSGIWTGTLVELEPTQTYHRAAGSLRHRATRTRSRPARSGSTRTSSKPRSRASATTISPCVEPISLTRKPPGLSTRVASVRSSRRILAPSLPPPSSAATGSRATSVETAARSSSERYGGFETRTSTVRAPSALAR